MKLNLKLDWDPEDEGAEACNVDGEITIFLNSFKYRKNVSPNRVAVDIVNDFLLEFVCSIINGYETVCSRNKFDYCPMERSGIFPIMKRTMNY
ncbi:MAG: hypothetical protein ACTSQY_00420 [Candidatus Odinarchaeia archaeon]|nr:MAG: hypothetical protein [Lokiarchaeota virus Fenrir Meg22_1012]URC17265.1 MAG: hypothetical protein [Lokiarchaeota virus Fenrir Meg22_1214]